MHVQDFSMSTAQPSLPPPNFPPPLVFDADILNLSYQRSDVVEKALILPRRPSTDLLSFDRSNNAYMLYGIRQRQEMVISTMLPPKRYPSVIRKLRFTFLTVYRRVFTLVVFLNLIPLVIILQQDPVTLDTLATAASTNFLIAILIRHDLIINGIFRTAWLVPWRVPLPIRRWMAKCYCYGGIHSGAAVVGTAWWVAFSVILTMQMDKRGFSLPLLINSWTVLAILTAVILLALPGFRKRHHNVFELTHRFLGWTCILLFWAQLLLVVDHTTSPTHFLSTLFQTPTFWNLTCMTALTLHPWLRLRTWVFHPTVLSPHAIRLHFTNRVHKFSCLSISTSPLREWHPFATFPTTSAKTPTADPQPSMSIIISDAGDWTHRLIRHAHTLETQRNHAPEGAPQTHMRLWVKQTPIPGVLSLTTLFPRVLLITTGSGIGPCLSSLLDRPPAQFVRLIWSTRSPLGTYGAALLSDVYAADPDALIVDTDAEGRPDLVRMGYALFRAVRAEAVFVLSNEKVTREVVYGLRCRGVSAFGPIFDS
ncbi:uncharacterized protein N0V89_008047 [Didymosphaeria variabile]|uniref:Integral membrane protein TmpA n=1 Tax=Didymosphaeria variabile TaxID=1932322 RepID=A0A9W9C901_9PLEO|nr:uncharacterized protein N0V89_008047 [Didymosphaeria variabile]KAJ4349432.1 hypothetical protein N0V89_008047 [Didymosphaeria variabile]